MGSVAVIYTARTLATLRALALYLLAFSALALWKFVWVHKVVENFLAAESRGIGSVANYVLTALGHAHTAVQISLLCTLFAIAVLAVDFIRSRTTQRSLAF